MKTTDSLSKEAAPAASAGDITPFDVATPVFDGMARPFISRPLRPAELKRLDVFLFFSPKENRKVAVIGPYQAAFRLRLEFTPTISAVTERPRKITVGGSEIEITFWWRERSGREKYALLIADPDTLPGSDGRRRPRQLERLSAAAREAAIDLQFVVEDEVKDKAARTALYFHLLTFVQSAPSLKASVVLRQEVLSAVNKYARCRIDQLEADLSRFKRSHLHIVVAELIYLGALETDATIRLSVRSLLWRRRA